VLLEEDEGDDERDQPPPTFRAIVVLVWVSAYWGILVDVPIWQIKNTRPMVVLREVRAFWITYRLPTSAALSITRNWSRVNPVFSNATSVTKKKMKATMTKKTAARR
jgi:hypothetical protein